MVEEWQFTAHNTSLQISVQPVKPEAKVAKMNYSYDACDSKYPVMLQLCKNCINVQIPKYILYLFACSGPMKSYSYLLNIG